MFTGIIETMGTVASIAHEGTNVHFVIACPITTELKVDQSVAHDGVCLTVTNIDLQQSRYAVTAIAETMSKTNLGNWKVGDKVNIERSLRVGDRLDGHFVQGHVDATATCIDKKTLDGSWQFRFSFPEQYAPLVIEKGSVCVNGVSLTAFGIGRNEFTVAIIPYTFEHTNFNSIEAGTVVNIEFDVLGKYLLRKGELQG
jgi:riboflavin synthase